MNRDINEDDIFETVNNPMGVGEHLLEGIHVTNPGQHIMHTERDRLLTQTSFTGTNLRDLRDLRETIRSAELNSLRETESPESLLAKKQIQYSPSGFVGRSPTHWRGQSPRKARLVSEARSVRSMSRRIAKISPEPLFTDKDVQKAIYGNLLDVTPESGEKQFIMDVLLTEDYHRWNAFCMGKHHRLGNDSPVRILPNCVFKVIRKFHCRDIENMVQDDDVEDILMIIEQTGCSVQTATKVYFETNRNLIESILVLYTWCI